MCVCVFVCVCRGTFAGWYKLTCRPISQLKFLGKSWMSIWREALSTCHEGLTSDLGSAGGSTGWTASCSDVFSTGENT